MFLTQRVRRETMLSMGKFRSVVQPRLPYLDHELVPLLLAAPVGLKLADTIQSYILRQRRPGFLNVTKRTMQSWRQKGGGPKFIRLSARCYR